MMLGLDCPTDPSTTFEFQNREIDKLNVVPKRRSTDFKNLKLCKGPSGGCSFSDERLYLLPAD